MEAQLSEKDLALTTTIKRVEQAEMAVKLHNDSLPALEKEWMDRAIQSCADEVVKELDKVYHQGYDLALEKFNLVADHEFWVAVTRLMILLTTKRRERGRNWPSSQKILKRPGRSA